MTYLLDFDRTLFDLDGFYDYVLTKDGAQPFADDLRAALMERRGRTGPVSARRSAAQGKLTGALKDGTIAFSPGELSFLLYPEVPEFLERAENDSVVITSGDRTRQEAKVKSALPHVPEHRVWYVEGSHKAEYLLAYRPLGKAVFADDYADELARVAALLPHMSLYEMRRHGEGWAMAYYPFP